MIQPARPAHSFRRTFDLRTAIARVRRHFPSLRKGGCDGLSRFAAGEILLAGDQVAVAYGEAPPQSAIVSERDHRVDLRSATCGKVQTGIAASVVPASVR